MFEGQRWSTVAASVVSTGAIGPSVHPPDEAPAGLSLSSQRVRLMLITSTQRSVPRSCWVVFFFPLSLPDRNLETSMRIHFHFHFPNQNVQTFGYVYHDTCGQNLGPSRKIVGRDNLEKFQWDYDGNKGMLIRAAKARSMPICICE